MTFAYLNATYNGRQQRWAAKRRLWSCDVLLPYVYEQFSNGVEAYSEAKTYRDTAR